MHRARFPHQPWFISSGILLTALKTSPLTKLQDRSRPTAGQQILFRPAPEETPPGNQRLVVEADVGFLVVGKRSVAEVRRSHVAHTPSTTIVLWWSIVCWYGSPSRSS